MPRCLQINNPPSPHKPCTSNVMPWQKTFSMNTWLLKVNSCFLAHTVWSEVKCKKNKAKPAMDVMFKLKPQGSVGQESAVDWVANIVPAHSRLYIVLFISNHMVSYGVHSKTNRLFIKFQQIHQFSSWSFFLWFFSFLLYYHFSAETIPQLTIIKLF